MLKVLTTALWLILSPSPWSTADSNPATQEPTAIRLHLYILHPDFRPSSQLTEEPQHLFTAPFHENRSPELSSRFDLPVQRDGSDTALSLSPSSESSSLCLPDPHQPTYTPASLGSTSHLSTIPLKVHLCVFSALRSLLQYPERPFHTALSKTVQNLLAIYCLSCFSIR